MPCLDSFSGQSQFIVRIGQLSRLDKYFSNIYIASLTENFGPHDAIWWDGPQLYLLQLSAGAEHSIDYFIDLLKYFCLDAQSTTFERFLIQMVAMKKTWRKRHAILSRIIARDKQIRPGPQCPDKNVMNVGIIICIVPKRPAANPALL